MRRRAAVVVQTFNCTILEKKLSQTALLCERVRGTAGKNKDCIAVSGVKMVVTAD